MAEALPTLDLVLALVRPALLAAGFEEAAGSDPGPYTWVRFRRGERAGEQRFTRIITVSHASAEGAYLADAYLVARDTRTQTPVGRELRRYGDAGDAESAARELAAAVLGWVGA